MTAPGSGDDFRMAGAYVELTVKDDTQAGVDEARAKIESSAPVEVPAVLATPGESELTSFRPETVEVPTEATNPIDEEWLAKVNAAVAGVETEPVMVGVDYSDAAAKIEAFEREIDGKPVDVPVVAENPITAAWQAQVNSDLRSIAKDALQIPVDADTAPFREQVAAQLAELADLREKIPLEIANSDAFRLQVNEEVQAISQSVKAVIAVDTDDASLADMRAKILAAADASAQEAKAQQDLADAMQKGDATEIAKAQKALAEAETEARVAADAQATSMEAVAAAEAAAGDGAEVAAVGMRSLDAAMGPMWAVMNILPMAMFAFTGSSSQASQGAQDFSQQLIALGQNGANAASSLSGNSGLAGINTQLETIGSSSAAFAQAFSGSLQEAKGYVDNLTGSQQALGAQSVQVGQQMVDASSGGKAAGESETATYQTTTRTIAQLTQAVNDHKISEGQLPQAVQDNINKYNAYNDVINQARKALADEQATQALVTQDLAASGIALSQSQQWWNSLGQSVANTNSEFNQSTSGIKSMTDATVAAAGANANAVANFAQLGQAVTSTEQAYQQSAHGIVTAEQGVQSALQGVSSAQYGVQQAEQSYQSALQQMAAAQQAIANARKQALQDEINLQLQANDAAAGQLSAGVNLFDATTAAAALGVTTANAHQVAGETVTATNEAQVKAAIALIEAQNQVADSTNSSATAQDALNTAQAQGINGAAGVVSANQQLVSSAQQVASAQHAVETAQLAAQSASLALQNAQYAVTQAQQAARQAAEAHQQAVDADSRSTDYSTQVGNQNWQMLENLFEKNFAATGSIQQATDWTEQEGQKMGFTSGQIDGVVRSITQIPLTTNFSIVGTPSLNLATLIQQAESEGININSLGLTSSQIGLANALTQPVRGGSYAEGGLFRGAGTPTSDSNIIAVSDQEYIVNAASTAKHLPLIEAINNDEVPGYASGGPISAKQAMAMNYHLAGWDAMLQSASHILQGGLGVNSPNLPQGNGKVDFGTFANTGNTGGGGAVPAVPSSRAANEAIVQSVFANQFGWTGPEWNATIQLLMQESGFNNTAQNPTSTAYGMFQFLNSTWGGYGIPKTSDPTQQAIAGGRYIKARYGDPLGAENHERAYHWFENGGYLPPGATMAANGTGRPEMVLPPSMSDTLERIDSSVQSGTPAARPSVTHVWNIAPVVKTDSPAELAAKVAGAVQWSLMTTVGG